MSILVARGGQALAGAMRLATAAPMPRPPFACRAVSGRRWLSLPAHTLLNMPALSPTMTHGNISRWVKKEGEAVSAGDTIAEVETDKATVDFEVLDDGVVAKLLVPEGASDLAVGTPVAVIVEDAGDVAAFKDYTPPAGEGGGGGAPPAGEPAAASPKAAAPPAPSAGGGAAATPPPSAAPAAPTAPAPSGGRAPASPLARRMAAAKGVDLGSIKGSGMGGRVIAADVEAAQVSAPAGAARASEGARAPPPPTDAEYEDTPHNNIRKITARRLTESKRDVPHYYLSMECSLEELMRLRTSINDTLEKEHKISVNDFIIKATAKACMEVPQANSAWFDEYVRTYARADVSMAVSTDKGLITPIIFNADGKPLSQIAAEAKDLATRARANKLKPEEFQGGTFTVSNLGMFGIKHFTAIINPPQACILAIGGAEKKVVAAGNGTFKEVAVMTVTLSSDHRVLDGAVGSQWLKAFKKYIETPALMLI